MVAKVESIYIETDLLGHCPYSLYQWHACLCTFLAHLTRPDTCLNLTDMSLMEHYHTETRLTDTSTYAQWEFALKKLLVEEEFLALILAFYLKLTKQSLLVNTDAH